MVKKTARHNNQLGFVYNDDYLDDIIGFNEPYPELLPSEQAQLDSDEDIYIVERILDKKKEGKKTLYLVKWEGFTEGEATWEPLANLLNVKDMVKEFDRKYEQQNDKKVEQYTDNLTATFGDDEKVPQLSNMNKQFTNPTDMTGNANVQSSLQNNSFDHQQSSISQQSKPIKKLGKNKNKKYKFDDYEDQGKTNKGRPKKQKQSKQQKPQQQIDESGIDDFEKVNQMMAQQLAQFEQKQKELQQQVEQLRQAQQLKKQQELQQQQQAQQEDNKVKSYFQQRKRISVPEKKSDEQPEQKQTLLQAVSEENRTNSILQETVVQKRKRGPNKKLQPVEPKCAANNEESVIQVQQSEQSNYQLEITQEEPAQLPETASFETDRPLRILSAKLSQNVIYVTLEWETRPNGFKPENGVFTNEAIKDKCPKLLVEFYESRINFRRNPAPSNEQQQAQQKHL